jgi:hypothetical protein
MAKFGKHGTAILIMAAIIAVLLMLCTPRSTSKSSAVGATTSLLDSLPPRWAAESLTTNWARFAANAAQSRGRAGVGSCHYPPNAKKEYEYDASVAVQSDAEDWVNYPNLAGARGPIAA